MEQFYTCLPAMRKRFSEEKRNNRFQAESREAYDKWKTETRKLLSELIGLPKMQQCDLNARVLERTGLPEGMTREKVLLQTEPGVYMPVYVLIPKELRKTDVPCFMAIPGHHSAGKLSIAGCTDNPLVNACIEKFHYDYGMQLAKEGFVVFCPDLRGMGERRELALQKDDEGSFTGTSCYQLAHMAEPLGMTVIGMNTWDILRLLDYIQTRKEWNTEKVGCLGFSGGGMQTLWAAALDDRISPAVISGYFYGYDEALLVRNGNCNCNYVPHLWEHVDMGDIGALLAPRPVWLQTCRQDHLNGARGVDNVKEQLEIVRRAYRLFGAEESVLHEICPGGHQWHEEHLEEYLNLLGV